MKYWMMTPDWRPIKILKVVSARVKHPSRFHIVTFRLKIKRFSNWNNSCIHAFAICKTENTQTIIILICVQNIILIYIFKHSWLKSTPAALFAIKEIHFDSFRFPLRPRHIIRWEWFLILKRRILSTHKTDHPVLTLQHTRLTPIMECARTACVFVYSMRWPSNLRYFMHLSDY